MRIVGVSSPEGGAGLAVRAKCSVGRTWCLDVLRGQGQDLVTNMSQRAYILPLNPPPVPLLIIDK